MRASLPLIVVAALLGCPSSGPSPEPPTPEQPTPAPRTFAAEAVMAFEGFEGVRNGGDLTGDGLPNLTAMLGPDPSLGPVVFGSPLSAPPTVIAWAGAQANWTQPLDIAADLNGDGSDDLFVSAPWDGLVNVWFGPVSGALGSPDWQFEGEEASFAGVDLRVLDVDGDGDQDLLLAAPGEPEEACSIAHHGTLLFAGPLEAGTARPEDAVTVFREATELDDCDGWFVEAFDANRDGILDVLIGSRSGLARLYLGPIAAGELGHDDAHVLLGVPGSTTWFWHDGQALPGGDLLMGYGQPGAIVALGLAYLEGPFGAGPVRPEDARIWITPTESFSPVQVTAGDWDADGVTDAAVALHHGGEVTIVMGPLATAGAQAAARYPLSDGRTSLFSADLDGDGIDELIAEDTLGIHVVRVVETTD